MTRDAPNEDWTNDEIVELISFLSTHEAKVKGGKDKMEVKNYLSYYLVHETITPRGLRVLARIRFKVEGEIAKEAVGLPAF